MKFHFGGHGLYVSNLKRARRLLFVPILIIVVELYFFF